MRKIFLILLMLIATVNLTVAQAPEIGLYVDTDALIQYAEIEVYTALDIYVIAQFYDFPSMTAAEFRIDNYIGDLPVNCVIDAANWNTPLVIGDPSWGIALAFSPSLPAPLAIMGSINVFLLDIDCIADEFEMWVVASNDSGKLVVVDGDYIEHDAYGNMFTLYTDLITATKRTSWSSLRSLY